MAGASTSAAGAAEGAAAKGKKGAAAAADPLIAEAAAAVLKADSVPPEKKSKMRGLVIGDSLSCDLPIDGTAVKGKSMARTLHDLTSDYECPPPTPYLAYLRRNMLPGQGVSNHVYQAMGVLDVIRTSQVPKRENASWREMSGPRAVITRPLGVLMTEEEWKEYPGLYFSKLPKALMANPAEKKVKGRFPAIKKPYEIRSRLMPLVPYWCITMKHTADHACFGRLRYAEPSDTVHSYYKPHWHRLMPPFVSRPTTVRDKARMQGFPDDFVFMGDVADQYKQVANAVSPQLAIALGRTLLTALIESHAKEAAPTKQPNLAAIEFKGGLLNFADFLKTFDEKTLAKEERFNPPDEPRRELTPLTYGEILHEYNTNLRRDHSSRFNSYTPFDILTRCQDNRNWAIDKFIGIRLKTDVEVAREARTLNVQCFEICGVYVGFDTPEWVDLYPDNHQTVQYGEFKLSAWGEVREVMQGTRRFFLLPGYPDVDPEKGFEFEEADEAASFLEEMADQYEAEFPDIVKKCRAAQAKEEKAQRDAKEKKASAARAKKGAAAGKEADGAEGGEESGDEEEDEEEAEELAELEDLVEEEAAEDE